jgi:RNA polymerase sigma factor (sigma-70 family)
MDDDLVERARSGDHVAWRALVDRCTPAAWAAIRRFRLQEADANDAYAWTFCRLVEHLDAIRDPEAVCGWVAATASRECLRILRLAGRVELTADPDERSAGALDEDPFARDDVEARRLAVWTAFETLSGACKRLLRVLTREPAPSYDDVSVELDIPRGSLGPTRARCLERLRQALTEGV